MPVASETARADPVDGNSISRLKERHLQFTRQISSSATEHRYIEPRRGKVLRKVRQMLTRRGKVRPVMLIDEENGGLKIRHVIYRGELM